MKREIINNRQTTKFNPFSPTASGYVVEHVQTYEEAVVEDVIVNDEHTLYSPDGYNVGSIKFRRINSDQYKDTANLSWAFPLDSNITDYPLLGELVIIISLLNRFYYSRKINVSSRVTSHAMPNLQRELGAIVNKTSNYTKHQINKESDISPLGKTFKDIEHNYRLKSFEGDIIYEGRIGQSIRFGSSRKDGKIFKSTVEDNRPNLLLRVGPIEGQTKSVDSPFGLIVEDVNLDASSLWMVSDQIVPLDVATVDNKNIHRKSVPDYPTSFDKNQIIINSDRIIINSKADKILAHSANGMHLTTLKNFTVDAERDYFSLVGQDRKIDIQRDNLQNVIRDMSFWIGRDMAFDIHGHSIISCSSYIEIRSKDRLSLISKKIYIGSQNSTSEPLVLGTSLTDILVQLLQAQISAAPAYTLTMTGPTKLNPGVLIAMNRAISALRSKTHLSQDNFVNKTNSSPGSTKSYQSLHS